MSIAKGEDELELLVLLLPSAENQDFRYKSPQLAFYWFSDGSGFIFSEAKLNTVILYMYLCTYSPVCTCM